MGEGGEPGLSAHRTALARRACFTALCAPSLACLAIAPTRGGRGGPHSAVKHRPDGLTSVQAAAQFVGKDKSTIERMIGETLEGHQRAIMAELTVPQIYKDRIMFQQKVRSTADVDLVRPPHPRHVSRTVVQIDRVHTRGNPGK